MSIPRLRLLVAAGATTALALTGTAAPAAAVTAPATTTDPAAAAAGWLAQQFRDASEKPSPTGDHLDFPASTYYFSGLTADAVFALSAAKAGAGRLHAAAAYIGAHVASDSNLDGGYGAALGVYDGTVAKAALALMVAGSDPRAVGGRDLLAALTTGECTAPVGSKTDYSTLYCPAKGAGRNVLSSVAESFVLLAEARGEALYGAKYAPSADALTFFHQLQCTAGGFTDDTDPTAPCVPGNDETSYAVFALQALGASHASDLQAAAQWLGRQQAAGGYWLADGKPNIDSTGLAVAALEASGLTALQARADAGRRWLAAQQVTSGPAVGAGATRGALSASGSTFNADTATKATADGLLGLTHGSSLATLSAAGAAPGIAVLAPSAAVTRPTVTAGGRQTVSASGFAAGEKVSAVLHSTPVSLGTVTASTTGAVSLAFTVPTALAAGTHTVEFTGRTSGLNASVTFHVNAHAVASASTSPSPAAGATSAGTAPAATPRGVDALAATGLDGRAALQFVLVGLGLVVAGAGAVYAGRRRA